MGIFSIFKKRDTTQKRKKIIIAVADRVGVFDITEMERFVRRLKAERGIVIASAEPAESVKGLSKQSGIEIRISRDREGELENLRRSLPRDRYEIVIRKMEEIADRSQFSDVM